MYKDSKFKNVKHELSHLFNTYDCEFKLRKEIKDKINSHPLVLKKHAMVVEWNNTYFFIIAYIHENKWIVSYDI